MKVGLLVNRAKQQARAFTTELVGWLKSKGHEAVVATSTAREYRLAARCCPAAELVKQVDLVIALGGDGTLLRAARLVGSRGKPIMGVNLGGLGFLTEFSVTEARRGIAAVAAGRHSEQLRMVLECRHGRKRGFCLNDCALNMAPSGRVVGVIVRSAGGFVNKFAGDGLVVATPTGSTAYSLAAGGPVVYPTMEAILLTPLCPHALAARPLILPADAEVELELVPGTGPAVLNLDGQTQWRIGPGKPVSITRADFSIRLVTPKGKTYYQILRDKMKWSGSQV